ncbi:hypothetical protein [Gottfriedia solisilvae]|uniref:hypothetical protein n=1 Tax=Gottfriedia solisilvae TaxID=1516104 RepID=UPI000B42DB5A|nr:hypothetical protein [Gottfriedia solisilvae]
MKKIFLRWIIVLTGLYTLCHILFGFNETKLTSSMISAIEAGFFFSILLYFILKEKENLNN